MQFKAKRQKKPLINITSLIDVLFLLLIFFMVSSTFLEEPGMKLTLPEAQSAEIGEKREFVLYITKDGEYYLNSISVSGDSLRPLLQQALPEMLEAALTLKADTETPHGLVVHAMDMARLAGVERLIVATAPKK